MRLAVPGLVCAAAMAWAVRGRSSTVFGPSVWRGNPGRRTVALTFDDGPSAHTAELLAALQDVPATFFLCGACVERLPEAGRALAAAGHEIGNHGYSHARLWLRSAAFIDREVALGQRAIAGVTGQVPRLFRAPYGVRWFGLREALERRQLRHVMWTVLGRDWTLPPRAVVERVLRRVSPGAIICLHDGPGRHAPAIVRQLVPALRARGLRFETVSQLLG